LASLIGILLEGKELVEPLQIRQRHAHVAHRRRLLPLGQRRRHDYRLAATQAQHDGLDVEARRHPARFDDALHGVDGMNVEQLQDADILFHAAAPPVLPFQGGPEFLKERRQLPAAKHFGVVECRRPTLQCFQVMTRIEHLLVPAVTPRVRRDHLASQHHLDAFDVDLDRDALERGRARHAVAIGVHADRLVLIHLGRFQ
jgi:hypothetical protein